MKGIRQHNLSFEILETDNPRTLVFVDSSEYFEQPEKPMLDVTLPGHVKYFPVSVEASHVNVFNSNTLGITEVFKRECLEDLPDGVYTLKLRICPYAVLNRVKFFLRTTQLSNKLKQIFDELDLSECSVKEDKKIRSEIVEIILLIESGKASAELANPNLAADKYQMAQKKVDKILDKLKTRC